MRVFPILAAIVVMTLIYVFIFERDRLFGSETQDVSSEMSQDASDGEGTADKSVGVVAVRSTARPVDTAVIVRGQTEADRQVELRAETSGQVVSEPLRKGAFVSAGQMLCRLDPETRAATLKETQARLVEARARIPEAEARLEEAQAQLDEAKINDNAAKKLSEGGFASETRVAATKASMRSAEASVQAARSGLQSTEAGIESAEAAVAVAEEEIARLTIQAPFEGLLESDTAEIGSLLQPGSLCATVIQLDPVMLVGFVPETQVNRVRLGALAEAELASGDRVQGQVTFMSRAADSATRTFRVEIKVPNPDLKLRDGQTAEIAIGSDGTDAHLIPQSALTLDDQGAIGVRVVTAQNLAEFVPVTFLRDTPNGVWITGLPKQADVIIIGQEYVTDGVKVDPTYQEIGQ